MLLAGFALLFLEGSLGALDGHVEGRQGLNSSESLLACTLFVGCEAYLLSVSG